MDMKDDKKKINLETQIKKLTEELNKTKKEVEEFKNKYLRALADYQNYEKRVSEEREELIKAANTGLIIKLLPFLDNLDKAEIFIKDPGLKAVKNHFEQMLTDSGVKEIAMVDKEFDPRVAEAVELVAGKEDNKVVEVIRKGYEYQGKILRIAQVKVSKRINPN